MKLVSTSNGADRQRGPAQGFKRVMLALLPWKRFVLLGAASDDAGHRTAKAFAQILQAHAGVFHGVMQQASDYYFFAETGKRQNHSHAERMSNVGNISA